MIIGLVVAATFATVAAIISARLNTHLAKMNAIIEHDVFLSKHGVVRNEFDKLQNDLQLSKSLFNDIRDKRTLQDRAPLISDILFSDSKVHQVWYVIIDGRDSSSAYFRKSPSGIADIPFPSKLKSWLGAWPGGLEKAKPSLMTISDSLMVVDGQRIRVPDGTELIYGYTLSLSALADYFSNVDTKAATYFALYDAEGRLLAYPDREHLGELRMSKNKLFQQIQKDGVSRSEISVSEFLGLKVKDMYLSFPFSGARWTLVISTPVSTFSDELIFVRRDILVLGILSIVIILITVFAGQYRWQREFRLRQAALKAADRLKINAQELQLRTERSEKENAMLQLQKLKEKIDPHFLFNSFGSLNALIGKDPAMAKKFVVSLSKVYRYILDSDANYLPSVEEELDFASQYYFLLKIRFREALAEMQFDVHPDDMQRRLPFMSVQTMIENAAKHNHVSKENPLHIRIQSDGHYLIVRNNYQQRQSEVVSGKQGLTYLEKTYQFYKSNDFRSGVEGDEYVCYLPLL